MSDFHADKQTLLDMLVDGELNDDQRREVLAWCEREPDGWRRCALAFLEAQSWSKVLGGLTTQETPRRAEATASVDRAPPVTPDRPRSIWNVRQWSTMLAMAASVVFAFTLGLWVREAGKAGPLAPANQPALNVVGNEQGAAGPIQLPVVPGNNLDDGWLLTQPSAMPDDVRRALERLGHRVEQQRRLVPYRMGDGRRVVVPVDQVEVTPVNNQSYQ